MLLTCSFDILLNYTDGSYNNCQTIPIISLKLGFAVIFYLQPITIKATKIR